MPRDIGGLDQVFTFTGVLMGHGRHTRALIGGWLLIASAIQGITPDARDLCSPAAIKLLVAHATRPADFRNEDDSTDEMALVADRSAPLQDWQQQVAPRFASSAWTEPVVADAAPTTSSRPTTMVEITPGLGLFEALCRLRC
jgi:hypothetical protein